MIDRIDVFRTSNERVAVPRIGVAVALSILVHLAALWELPPITVQLPGTGEDPNGRPQLSLRLMPQAPPSPPAIAARPRPSPAPALRAQRPQAVPRPQPAPPVIALKQPQPDMPSPAPVAPPVPAPQPAPRAIEGDMASYIEARRRARGDSAPTPPSAGDEAAARTDRIIAGNLGSQRDRTFGYDPRQGGGMFQIERMSVDYAEFIFYGWSKDIGRNTKQLIEVRKGNDSDIRLAVVRRMIAIIRENTQEDFLWVSQRLGRSLMLSAHPRDNAGLEEFMMREFFYDANSAPR